MQSRFVVEHILRSLNGCFFILGWICGNFPKSMYSPPLYQTIFVVFTLFFIIVNNFQINRNAAAHLIHELDPVNEGLLKSDEHYSSNQNRVHDSVAHGSVFSQIDHIYNILQGHDFKVDTSNVDEKITCMPRPQSIVPVNYAVNASIYGSDAALDRNVYPLSKPSEYNPTCGNKEFETSHKFLDAHFPLSGSGLSCDHVSKFKSVRDELECELADGCRSVRLLNGGQFIGFNGGDLESIVLQNNVIKIHKTSRIGSTRKACIKDNIIDSEDSVSAVDAFDKSNVYSNWSGLIKTTLTPKVTNNSETVARRLNEDCEFVSTQGGIVIVATGSLLSVRYVVIHMYTDTMLLMNNQETPEEGMDLQESTRASLLQIGSKNNTRLHNSRRLRSSMCIVKAKMRGPEEVAFVVKAFDFTEKPLVLKENTSKMVIMDDERHTTINLFE